MMEALVGSLPKTYSGSMYAPPKVNPDSKEVVPVKMASEAKKCFQIPEACISEDTSKLSASDDNVYGLSGNNMLDSEDDEDLISDEAQGNQSAENPVGNKQVTGITRCSYADIIKFPKSDPIIGLGILEESL
jgi:hypothetical protein